MEKYRPGYEWYPDQWKTSDTFMDVDDPLVRYFYREILDILYLNKNKFEANRRRFEKAMRYVMEDNQWADLRAIFEVEIDAENVEFWSHKSVTKRIDGRIYSSPENGAKGGRPEGSEKPKNNLKINQNKNLTKPNEPISTKKRREDNRTKPNVNEGLVSVGSTEHGASSKPPNPTPQPLWAAGLRDGSVLPEVWGKYADFLAEKIPGMDRARLEKAWLNFWPRKIPEKAAEEFREMLKTIPENSLREGVEDIALLLTIVGQEGATSSRISDFDNHISFFNQYVPQ